MQIGQRNVLPVSNFRRSSVESLGPQVPHSRNFDGTRSLRRQKPPQIRKLSGTAHFHYDNVELGPLQVYLEESTQNETFDVQSRSNLSRKVDRLPFIFVVTVLSNGKIWNVKRSYQDFFDFDKQLHRCVYDRRISKLTELIPFSDVLQKSNEHDIFESLSNYLKRFSDLAGSLITCFPVLKWLELDNRGNRLLAAEETPINTPAVAAAYVVRDYSAQANNELNLKIGDIISVIDMPPPSESFWWRGKLTIGRRDVRLSIDEQPSSPLFEVGFFPSDCVQLFGNRVHILPSVLRDGIYEKPVFQRRGKLVAFFRAFLATRPSRRRLKESGILLERVFGCDLAEHLQNTGNDVPPVLKVCCNVIESHGIVDGIYRLSGALSNIQKLRTAFDDNKEPDLLDEAILRDIHCVASLLKMYFRELPNPLLTYQLYNSFVEAAMIEDHSLRILRLHDIVQQLPPPHFRTAEYIIKHLAKVGEAGFRTGMNYQNLAIVWAPNLLRCKELENIWESAGILLRNVNVQAVIVEYLIRYVDIIFSRKLPIFATCPQQAHDMSSSSLRRNSRPQSLTVTSPSKLIDLEEAQRKLMAARLEKIPADVGLPDLSNRKCIDVNGGPAALPVKYHTIIEIPARLQRKGSGWKMFFSSNKSGSNSSSSPYSSTKVLPTRHQRKYVNHLPPTTNVIFRGNRDNHKSLRHVKSAESLMSSNCCQPDAIFKQKRRGPNRRSLREPTPLRDDMSNSRPSTLKPCLATDLDAAYSSNESHLFGALNERRRSAVHHVPYAISVHVNLEHLSPSSDQFESIISSPRCESSLICYETSLVSSNTTPVSDEQVSFERDITIEEETFSSVVSTKKVAKVSPMTSDWSCYDSVNSNDKSVREISSSLVSPDAIEPSASSDLTPTTITSTTTSAVENNVQTSCQLISTNFSPQSSSYVDGIDHPIMPIIVEQTKSTVAPLADQEIVTGTYSISPLSTMSSVYTLNLFDDDDGRKSVVSTDNDEQRTSRLSSDEFASFDDTITKNEKKDSIIDSEIDSIGPECVRDSLLIANALCKESTTSLIEFDKSEHSNITLDPEVCTLLSSVENLPTLSDASNSYAKKFNSFEEANALLQSFESLDQIGCDNGRLDNLVIDEEEDDDDELLISLYENVEDEPKKVTSAKKNVVDRDSLRSKVARNEFVNNASRYEKDKTAFIDDNSASFVFRNVNRKERFTESDEETQSRKVIMRNEGYASTDSSSARSVGLKIADAIAMFEKTSLTKSNSSSRESSLGRSDGRNIVAALAAVTASSQVSRRPSGFVLVRTPSSYESADENELANSPLFRKQQNLLTDGNFVVDEMDPLAVVEGHHRALTASSTSINRAGSVTSLRQSSTSSTTTIGNNNLQLYFV